MSRGRGTVRRRLFDEPPTNECEQLNNINVSEDNEQLLDRKQEEWNFDFRNGRPLPGRYAWQPMVSNTVHRARPCAFTPVATRTTSNESITSQVNTTSTRHGSSRSSNVVRHSPYNLRSRTRNTRTVERGFYPVSNYSNRDRSSSRSSNASSERPEGDVRT
ncbi:uncharacterized protein LOC124456542 [Xenia sp. Carnegie-2017]|uniref:uncharacterized protein LOC124456542 n=1 Tax=Xenia sp. Carnegie-2017 TaxID=2897299 RepID=UPI001F037D98|nr:uncharacterized protein LOC124456542 [Xenia sp. Carnegie-2017]